MIALLVINLSYTCILLFSRAPNVHHQIKEKVGNGYLVNYTSIHVIMPFKGCRLDTCNFISFLVNLDHKSICTGW